MNLSKISKWPLQNNTLIFSLLFGLGLSFLAFIQYYGVIRFHYIVPPGDDPMNHWLMAKPFYDHTAKIWEVWKQGAYPPGFHIFISSLAHLLHTDLLSTIVWFYPSIIIFSSLAIFFLTKIIFDRWTALLAFFMYGFTAESSIQLLNDGGYPNLIAAHVFIPLFLIFLLLAVRNSSKTKKIIYSTLSVISALLVVFTHHISTFYLLGIILLSIPVLILVYMIRGKLRWNKGILFFTIYFIFLGFCLYLFKHSALFAPARGLSNMMIQFQNAFPFFKIIGKADPATIPSKRSYLIFFGSLIFATGILGYLYSAISVFKKKTLNIFPQVILLVWTSLLLIGSRLQFLTNPERMARDAVVPFTILGAGFSIILIRWLKPKPILRYSVICLLLFLSINPIIGRIKVALSYASMVRFTSADKKAIDYLQSKQPLSILTDAQDFYLPIFLKNSLIDYNFSGSLGDKNINSYDYLYLVDQQKGWIPSSHLYLSKSPDFKEMNVEKVKTFSGLSNQISVYRVKK